MLSDITSFSSQQGKNFIFVNSMFIGKLFFSNQIEKSKRVFRKVNPSPTGAVFFVGIADKID